MLTGVYHHDAQTDPTGIRGQIERWVPLYFRFSCSLLHAIFVDNNTIGTYIQEAHYRADEARQSCGIMRASPLPFENADRKISRRVFLLPRL